jgi:hypothetical protein
MHRAADAHHQSRRCQQLPERWLAREAALGRGVAATPGPLTSFLACSLRGAGAYIVAPPPVGGRKRLGEATGGGVVASTTPSGPQVFLPGPYFFLMAQ